jgi:hypothetical protein
MEIRYSQKMLAHGLAKPLKQSWCKCETGDGGHAKSTRYVMQKRGEVKSLLRILAPLTTCERYLAEERNMKLNLLCIHQHRKCD